MTARQMLRLSSVAVGQRARVIDVISRNPASVHRLSSLGVTQGVVVTVLQTFPGVIFLCDETELAIEPDIARSIVVEIIETA